MAQKKMKKIQGAVERTAKPKPEKKEEKPKHEKPEPPRDPKAVDQKNNGGPTDIATVVFCSTCGESNMIPAKASAGGIKAKCHKCESVIKISGAKLGKIRISASALQRADQLALIPSSKDTPGKGGGKAGITTEYVFLRVRLGIEQMEIVRLAMEACRRSNSVEGTEWAGRSLELICADFISGADMKHIVAAIKKEQEAARADK